MSEKNNQNKAVKKPQNPDTEYSGNLTPSAGRVKEAGYGKSMDLELADIGPNQAKNEAEIYDPEWKTENVAKVKPETNIIQPDDAGTTHDFEFGNMGIPNNPTSLLKNTNNTGVNTEFAGELAGNKINDRKEIGTRNFEFGAENEADLLPTEKSQHNKLKINRNNWTK